MTIDGEYDQTGKEWILLLENELTKAKHLEFTNIVFSNTYVAVKGIKLFFDKCHFQGNTSVDMLESDRLTFYFGNLHQMFGMSDSVWRCCSQCSAEGDCHPSCHLKLVYRSSDARPLSLRNVSFQNTWVTIKIIPRGHDDVEIVFRDIRFLPGTGSLHLRCLGTPEGKGKDHFISFQNCTFSDLDLNWKDTALKIFLVQFLATDDSVRQYHTEIRGCVFENNLGRGLQVSANNMKYFLVTNCKFKNNTIEQGDGAGALLLVKSADDDPNVLIHNCCFTNNAAGYESDIDNFKSLKHTSSARDGNGGAVNLHARNVVLKNCLFVNNSASQLGGSLYLSKVSAREFYDGNVTIFDCHFTLGFRTTTHGAVVYSLDTLTLKSITVSLQNPTGGVSVLEHIDASLTVENFSLTCPPGEKLDKFEHGTKKLVETLVRLNSLELRCSACPKGLYSVEVGRIRLSLSNDTVHQLEHRTFTCRTCPYAASCDGQVALKPSYWGYEHKNALQLYKCAPHHCCPGDRPCLGYKNCANNRKGKLCTECVEGHHLTLFADSCVEARDCNDPLWFWIAVLVCSFGYVSAMLLSSAIHGTVASNIHLSQENFVPCIYAIVFFCQDASYMTIDRHAVHSKESPILKLLAFQMSVLDVNKNICFKKISSPILTSFLMSSFCPVIFLQLLLMILTIAFACKHFKTSERSAQENTWHILKGQIASKMFHTVVFGVQPLSFALLTLVHCTRIGDSLFLSLDTTVTCFQIWQFVTVLLGALWLIPFVFCTVQQDQSQTNILFALLPLARIFFSAERKIRKRSLPKLTEINWTSLTLCRRLLFYSVCVFVSNTMQRTVILTSLQMAAIILLLLMQPHKQRSGMFLELILTSITFTIGVSNTIKAAFSAAMHKPQSLDKTITSVLDGFENVVFVWAPPFLALVFLVCLIIWQYCVRSKRQTCKAVNILFVATQET